MKIFCMIAIEYLGKGAPQLICTVSPQNKQYGCLQGTASKSDFSSLVTSWGKQSPLNICHQDLALTRDLQSKLTVPGGLVNLETKMCFKEFPGW